eukprot:1149508-Pelagomonas_calceolata.AAC.3
MHRPNHSHEVYNEAWQKREGHQEPAPGNRNFAPAEAREHHPDAGLLRDKDGLLCGHGWVSFREGKGGRFRSVLGPSLKPSPLYNTDAAAMVKGVQCL